MMLKENLRSLLSTKNLTQTEFARRSEVSEGTIRGILTGRVKDPRISIIAKIAKALDVTLDELYYGRNVIEEEK